MAFEHLMAYDGTSWQRIQIRTGADNLANTIQGLIANGFMYVYDGTAWDRLRGDSTDGMLVNLGVNNDVTTELAAAAALADAVANPTTPIVGAAHLGFNDTTWDRWRNNVDVEFLASAARTSTTNSADQTNYNARGVMVTLNITAVPGGDTIHLRIQWRHSASGFYRNLLIDASQSAIGLRTVIVYPGVGAVADGVQTTRGFPLGRVWRVRVDHSGSGSFTYDVNGTYIV